MDLGDLRGHLTYSTLVHAGDTWPEMWNSLITYVPEVKRAVCPDAPFGVSLRLSAASAAELTENPDERRKLKEFLDSSDMYLYTVNAFPYGPFKGRQVKEQVYEPDWQTDERVEYTIQVADILAEVAAPGASPSIQTAPLAFRPNITSAAQVTLLTTNVMRVVAHLVRLERRTGRRVKLALEPEPYCYLETIDDTVKFFTEQVFTDVAASELAMLAGIPLSEAIGAMRRYLGVVFDICHQAVEFEDITQDLADLKAAGIPVFKLQEAAALWLPEVDDEIIENLSRFTDTIYLSQTTELRGGRLTKFLNLEDAIAAYRLDPGPREWRTHFHVPVFLTDLGPFKTTRFAIEAALAVHRAEPVSDHLEIETYTWDVLPDHLKTGSITDYVVREINWVKGQVVGV